MGMDLKPKRPTSEHPCDEDGPVWGRYNVFAWEQLSKFVQFHGLRPLPMTNDGYLITEKKCKRIAELLRDNREPLAETGDKWMLDNVDWWESCGGCRVY